MKKLILCFIICLSPLLKAAADGCSVCDNLRREINSKKSIIDDTKLKLMTICAGASALSGGAISFATWKKVSRFLQTIKPITNNLSVTPKSSLISGAKNLSNNLFNAIARRAHDRTFSNILSASCAIVAGLTAYEILYATNYLGVFNRLKTGFVYSYKEQLTDIKAQMRAHKLLEHRQKDQAKTEENIWLKRQNERLHSELSETQDTLRLAREQLQPRNLLGINQAIQLRNERDDYRAQVQRLEVERDLYLQIASTVGQGAGETPNLRQQAQNYRQQFEIIQRRVNGLNEQIHLLERENNQLKERLSAQAAIPENLVRLNNALKTELAQVNLNATFWRSNGQMQAVAIIKKYLIQLPSRAIQIANANIVEYEQSAFNRFVQTVCSTLWSTKQLELAKTDLSNLCMNPAIATKDPHLLSLLKQNGTPLHKVPRELIAQIKDDSFIVRHFVPYQTPCQICLCEEALASNPVAFNCGHVICRACKEAYIHQKIQSGDRLHLCPTNCEHAF